MTTAEIALVLYWGVLGAIWVFLMIDVVTVTIRTTGVGSCLLVLIILGSASIGFIWRARSSWRRSLARPIPDRGPSGWLWRQPGSLLALLFGMLFYLATIGGIQLGDLVYNHGSLQGFGLVLLATFPALLAIGQAARWCIRRERQLGSAADVADGSRATLDPGF
jgi:hypothetical protein